MRAGPGRPPGRRLCRRAFAALAGLAVVLAVVLGGAVPAGAHATLISTDPVEGSVLDAAPDAVTFVFDEPVLSVPDGVAVFAADGTPVPARPEVVDARLVVALDEEVQDGTLVVVWRVLSTDGHPISGSLTFSVGAASQTVVEAPGAAGSAARAPVWLSLVRWVGYLGLLLSSGLVAFAVLCLPRGSGYDLGRRRVLRTAAVGGVVAAAAFTVGLPMTAAYQLGSDELASVSGDALSTLQPAELVVTAAVVLGLLGALVLAALGRPGPTASTALVAAAAAAAAPSLTGHTRTGGPDVLALAADVLHLLAGSVWLGGLAGLGLVLAAPAGRGRYGVEVLARFSGLAAGVLAALVAAGSVLAWRILGSWDALLETGYGRLLLLKVGIAVVAVLVALFNRRFLVPRVRAGARAAGAGGAPRMLARSTLAEAAVLAGVVLVTGFLVDTSPEVTPAQALTRPVPDPEGEVRATLGDVVVVGGIDPLAPGPTTLSVRLEGPDGGPAESVESLQARLSSDDVDLGEVPLVFAGPGRYTAEVVLPAPGTWRLQVSVRRSEFVNPVTTLDIEVPAA